MGLRIAGRIIVVAVALAVVACAGGDAAGGNVALCRRGLSEVKPFCDGSHNAGGFDSAPTATDQPYPW